MIRELEFVSNRLSQKNYKFLRFGKNARKRGVEPNYVNLDP